MKTADSPKRIGHELPARLTESPPNDRWCDLVLAGGVASGVVYPWAILELARHFRFRSIGGTSVGAMAGAIAAACEFGRRNGNGNSFEVMRRLPHELAERVEPSTSGQSITKMLSLFQPNVNGQRLFAIVIAMLNRHYRRPTESRTADLSALIWAGLCEFAKQYRVGKKLLLSVSIGLFTGLVLAVLLAYRSERLLHWLGPWILIGVMFPSVVAVFWRLWLDIRADFKAGLIDNDFGFCRGTCPDATESDSGARPALIEYMHEAIQLAAGFDLKDPPLTFEELWRSPLWPGGPRPEQDVTRYARERSIDLQVVATNVTHGRPYSFPHHDPDARLFFRLDEWKLFFPASILVYLGRVSEPYKKRSSDDPNPECLSDCLKRELRELPFGKLPIVVAARLSLSYPLLFSSLPLYAIDHLEGKLRRCSFSDGGLCSNFPVHFFDSAIPRWPTFGLWLQSRNSKGHKPVELPERQDEGVRDSFKRTDQVGDAASLAGLKSFLLAAFDAAKDWQDRSAIRMPHVRRRVARISLEHEEGQLNLGMSSETILRMASIYGTRAGRMLCRQYAPPRMNTGPTRAWREHLWVRAQVLLDGLEGLLGKFEQAATNEGHTMSLSQLLSDARKQSPVMLAGLSKKMSSEEERKLLSLIKELVEIERSLAVPGDRCYIPRPQPPLRLAPYW